jgi:hypothetical protein
MIYLSIVILAIAAAWGAYLAASILGNKSLTQPVIIGHGVVAAIGLVILVIASASLGFLLLNGLAVVLLVLAAIVGAAMYFGRVTSQLIGLHAVLAVAGFILTLVYAFAAKPA